MTPFLVQAAAVDCGTGFKLVNGLCLPESQVTGNGIASTTKLSEVVPNVITILLSVSGVIAVLFIIIGGFQYMTSSGNPEAAKKGRQTLTYAIVGLVIIVLSYIIVSVVLNTLTTKTI